MIPFFLVPAIGLSARGVAGLVEARSRRPHDEGHREKELLEALARHGEITAAKAALETSLSVSEADRMLSGLAKDGHVEVRAREGSLVYTLWEHDRRELTA
jgi:predicted ArsR family transcriptional regulator